MPMFPVVPLVRARLFGVVRCGHETCVTVCGCRGMLGCRLQRLRLVPHADWRRLSWRPEAPGRQGQQGTCGGIVALVTRVI